MMQPTTLPRLVRVPGIMSGRLCVEWTRVLVATLVDYIVHGATDAEIHGDYPNLPPGAPEAVRRWIIERERNA